jgi:multiple sugar transport system substrate-binding protein
MTGAVLASCRAATSSGGRGTPAPEARPALRAGVKLLLLGNQAPVPAQAVAEIVAEFGQRYPGLSAEYSNQPEGYYDKLQALLAAETAPDMCWIDVRQFPRYAAGRLLRLLDPWIRRDRYDIDDFHEKGIAQYRWDGGLYGVSWDFGFRQIFYNVNLFQEAGVPLPPNSWKAPGWSFSDFLETARRLTKAAGPGQITQFGFANTTDWMPWVYANGGRITNEENTESWLDRAEAIEAFGFLADLMHTYQVAQTPAQMRQQSPIAAFMQGQAAMSVHPTATGTAQFRTITDFVWDVTPMPRGPRLSGDRRTHGGGSGWTMPAPGKNPEEAWALFTHVTSRASGEKLARAGVAPARKSVARSAAWLDPALPPRSKQVFVEGGDYIMPNPKLLTWDEFLTAVNRELSRLWEGQTSAAATGLALRQATAPIIQRHLAQLDELRRAR